MGKESNPTNPFSMAIRKKDGARIPGGCDRCDAYQTIQADYWGKDAHRLTTHHDDWCPAYQNMRK